MKRLGIRKLILIALDLVIAVFSLAVSTVISEHFTVNGLTPLIHGNFWAHAAMLFVIAFFARLIVFRYTTVWRYSTANDYIKFIATEIIVFAAYTLVDRFIFFENRIRIEGFHYSGVLVPLAAFAIDVVLILLSRFIYVAFFNSKHSGKHGENDGRKNAVIVGAGEAGVLLERELLRKDSQYRVVGFIDSDPEKSGKRIQGIKIYDEKEVNADFLKALGVDTVIIAIPSASPAKRGEFARFYANFGYKVRIYEYSMSRDEAGSSVMRDVRIEDLLGRDVVKLDISKFKETVKGKCVLVTGAGGSIGSELCRQIASADPGRLVMLDVYENTTYNIQQELRRKYGGALKLTTVITTICDAEAIDRVFGKYRPDIVFHAAAHKHVPLMEDACREAVLNNVFGTYNVVNAAEKYGVTKMVSISTDKAVNPTNIMGATKRLCEMILLSKSDSTTDYVAVRFGNVLGSNGSVIPLFKEQIANGGPVTLTDKRIVRYFMTIPEAVSLVLETETIAADSEIFVLDMGEPVKILDLAESLITLSGFRPYKDIDIIEVGLRPGEKLYEELLVKTEGLIKTDNQKIFIDRDTHLTPAELEEKLKILREACDTCDNDKIRDAVASVVPTYTPTDNTESRRNASHLSCASMENR